jgi:hypothetical protein
MEHAFLSPGVSGQNFENVEGDEKGPDARRYPKAAREAYSPYVERAAEGSNEADGPLSSS